MKLDTCHHGDALEVLRTLPDECVQTCVTSPPYWGLRDYGTATWEGGADECDHLAPMPGGTGSQGLNCGEYAANSVKAARHQYRETCAKCGARRIDSQLGLESTPEEYVARMVEVFAEVRRVLRADGTIWVNLGDAYNSGTSAASRPSTTTDVSGHTSRNGDAAGALRVNARGLKPKDLVGIPWRVAFALQADGWYLRQDIIWAKPNPMPESVTDRCTKAHEYVFLLSKSARYYFDAGAIAEPSIGTWNSAQSSLAANGVKNVALNQTGQRRTAGADTFHRDEERTGRNRRSVWTVPSAPYPDAHFATFPPALIEPCILAGAPAGGVVLDQFMGSGTTAQVAQALNRRWIGVELNAEYIGLQDRRTAQASLPLG